MSVYFDSSALVAAFIEEEQHHVPASEALKSVEQGFTSTHSLAEEYTTLTSGRVSIRVTPVDARQVLETNIISRLKVLQLTLADYQRVLVEAEARGVRGAAIYDLLHLQVARNGNAKKILTVNVLHFQSFAPDLLEIIQLP